MIDSDIEICLTNTPIAEPSGVSVANVKSGTKAYTN